MTYITIPLEMYYSPEIIEAILKYEAQTHYCYWIDSSFKSQYVYLDLKHLNKHNVIKNMIKLNTSNWITEPPAPFEPWFNYMAAGILPSFQYYLNLTEIMQLLPNSKELGISRNALLHMARLIQFFESTRYLEAFYGNLPYNLGEYPTLYGIITPYEVFLFDHKEQLLAKFEILNARMSYTGRQALEYRSIITFLKSSTVRFIKSVFPRWDGDYNNWERLRPMTRIAHQWFTGPYHWLNKFKKPQFTFNNFVNFKKEYMKKYNLKEGENFTFRIIKIKNPFYAKWGARPALVRNNFLKKPELLKTMQETLDQAYEIDKLNPILMFKEAFNVVKNVNDLHENYNNEKKSGYHHDNSWATPWSFQQYGQTWAFQSPQQTDNVLYTDDLSEVPDYNHPKNFWDIFGSIGIHHYHHQNMLKEKARIGIWKKRLFIQADFLNQRQSGRFMIRSPEEFAFNHSPRDVDHLRYIRHRIEKLIYIIQGEMKKENLMYPVQTRWQYKRLVQLYRYYIKAHTTYHKNRFNTFFQRVLLLPQVPLSQKLRYIYEYYWSSTCKVKSRRAKKPLMHRINLRLYMDAMKPYIQLTGMMPRPWREHFILPEWEDLAAGPEFINSRNQNLYRSYIQTLTFKNEINAKFNELYAKFKGHWDCIVKPRYEKIDGQWYYTMEPRRKNQYGTGIWYREKVKGLYQLDDLLDEVRRVFAKYKAKYEGRLHMFDKEYSILETPKNNHKSNFVHHESDHGNDFNMVLNASASLKTHKRFQHRKYKKRRKIRGWRYRNSRLPNLTPHVLMDHTPFGSLQFDFFYTLAVPDNSFAQIVTDEKTIYLTELFKTLLSNHAENNPIRFQSKYWELREKFRSVEFYQPGSTERVRDFILDNKFAFGIHYEESNPIPEWIDLYEINNFIHLLLLNSDEHETIRLLRLLKKHYTPNYIRPLFTAVVGQDNNYKKLQQLYSQNKYIAWLLEPESGINRPFDLSLERLLNDQINEFYSITRLKSLCNQYVPIPDLIPDKWHRVSIKDQFPSGVVLNNSFESLSPLLIDALNISNYTNLLFTEWDDELGWEVESFFNKSMDELFEDVDLVVDVGIRNKIAQSWGGLHVISVDQSTISIPHFFITPMFTALNSSFIKHVFKHYSSWLRRREWDTKISINWGEFKTSQIWYEIFNEYQWKKSEEQQANKNKINVRSTIFVEDDLL